MKPFSLVEYKDPASGKTPTDAIADALMDLLKTDNQLIRLAAFRNHLKVEGQLYGRCLTRVKRGDIQIWAYSQGRFHLIYSFYKARNEICLLKFVNGIPEAELDDVKERLHHFYSDS